MKIRKQIIETQITVSIEYKIQAP